MGKWLATGVWLGPWTWRPGSDGGRRRCLADTGANSRSSRAVKVEVALPATEELSLVTNEMLCEAA